MVILLLEEKNLKQDKEHSQEALPSKECDDVGVAFYQKREDFMDQNRKLAKTLERKASRCTVH